MRMGPSLLVKDPRAMTTEIVIDIPPLFGMKLEIADCRADLVPYAAFIAVLADLLHKLEQVNAILPDAQATTLKGDLEKNRRLIKKLAESKTSQVLLGCIQFLSAYIDASCFNNFKPLGKFIQTPFPDESLLNWYRASACFMLVKSTGKFNNNVLEIVIDCLEGIKLKNLWAGVVSIFVTILHHHEAEEYLSEKSLDRLTELLSEDPGLSYIAVKYSQVRQQFVLNKLIKNADYFKHIDSSLLESAKADSTFNVAVKVEKTDTISGKKVDLKIELTPLILLRFMSQFSMISFPGQRCSAPGFTPAQNDLLNSIFDVFMKDHGFVNSSGMIIKSKVFKSKGEYDTLAPEFLSGMTKIFKRISPKVSDKQLDEAFVQFIKRYQDIIAKRNRLARFIPINALALLYSVMSDPAPAAKEIEVNEATAALYGPLRGLIRDSLAIAVEAKKINDSGRDHPSKHAAWFHLAGTVVDKLWEHPKDLIVQVGTPIKSPATYSDHAFYVLLKYHAESDQFQIMIVNGGPGLSFHEKDPSLDEKEYADQEYGMYQPVISIMLARNDYNQEFLKNYCYRLIVLAYTPFVTGLMANIYLGERAAVTANFSGYGLYTSTQVTRAASATTYTAQLSENCTVHNFKNALKLALNMSTVRYYEFETWLLQLADSWIDSLVPLGADKKILASGAAKAGAGGVFEEAEEEEAVLTIVDEAVGESASLFSTLTLFGAGVPGSAAMPEGAEVLTQEKEPDAVSFKLT